MNSQIITTETTSSFQPATGSPIPEESTGGARNSAEREAAGFPQGGSAGRATGRIALGVEAASGLSDAGRLGVRIAAHEGKAAVLADLTVAAFRTAGPEACRRHEGCDLPHVSAHVRNAAQRQWRKPQGGAGTAPARQPQGDDRRLHAGGQPSKEGSTRPVRQPGAGHVTGPLAIQRAFPVGPRLDHGPWQLKWLRAYWTIMDHEEKAKIRVNSLFCWRPRRDSNPCYRRERAVS